MKGLTAKQNNRLSGDLIPEPIPLIGNESVGVCIRNAKMGLFCCAIQMAVVLDKANVHYDADLEVATITYPDDTIRVLRLDDMT